VKFDLHKSLQILERTPKVVHGLLSGLAEDWTSANEGNHSWCAYDIIGHFIQGEMTDWMTRMEIILDDRVSNKQFETFDRFAQFEASRGKSLEELLRIFKMLRKKNLNRLKKLGITPEMLKKTGAHPEFGKVTLAQLIATWVVHDLGHIAQISRVMAKQYTFEVGPWQAYLPVLNDRNKI